MVDAWYAIPEIPFYRFTNDDMHVGTQELTTFPATAAPTTVSAFPKNAWSDTYFGYRRSRVGGPMPEHK